MMEFTDKQIEMLYMMSDLQFQWFNEYTPESEVKYQDIIKMNHQKMIDICSQFPNPTEENIDFLFETVINDYRVMLDNLF